MKDHELRKDLEGLEGRLDKDIDTKIDRIGYKESTALFSMYDDTLHDDTLTEGLNPSKVICIGYSNYNIYSYESILLKLFNRIKLLESYLGIKMQVKCTEGLPKYIKKPKEKKKLVC